MNRALELTHSLNGEAMLLHVVDDRAPMRFVGRSAAHALDALKWHARRRLAVRVQPELSVRLGDATKTIASAAKQWRADLIVIGKHRRRRADLVRLSTAERIARRTGVPVLVVNTNSIEAYRNLVLADSRRPARLMYLAQRFSLFNAARIKVAPVASGLERLMQAAGKLGRTLRIPGAHRLQHLARLSIEQRLIDTGLLAMRGEMTQGIPYPREVVAAMRQARGSQLLVVRMGRTTWFDRSARQSTARLALRQRACDVLFVPATAAIYASEPENLAVELG